jgi:hypothetical protein
MINVDERDPFAGRIPGKTLPWERITVMESEPAPYQSSDSCLLAAAQVYHHFRSTQALFQKTMDDLVDRSHSQPLEIGTSTKERRRDELKVLHFRDSRSGFEGKSREFKYIRNRDL